MDNIFPEAFSGSALLIQMPCKMKSQIVALWSTWKRTPTSLAYRSMRKYVWYARLGNQLFRACWCSTIVRTSSYLGAGDHIPVAAEYSLRVFNAIGHPI